MILCKKSPSISSLWIPYGSCSNYLWKDNYLSDKANGKKETGNLGERKHSWGWQRGSACGFPRSLSCQAWDQVFKLQKRDFGARMTKKHKLNWCHESWSPNAPAGGIGSTGCLFPALAKSVLKVSSLDWLISSC